MLRQKDLGPTSCEGSGRRANVWEAGEPAETRQKHAGLRRVETHPKLSEGLIEGQESLVSTGH